MNSVRSDLTCKLKDIELTGSKFREWIKRMPKAEIHLHCEAVVSPESYLELNRRHGIDPNLKGKEEFERLLDMKDLSDMIKNFIYLQSFFKNEEDFDLLIEDLDSYGKRNNIRYMEVFFSPSMFRKYGLNPDLILKRLEKGFDRIQNEGGSEIYILVDVSRTFGIDNAKQNLRMVVNHKKNNPESRILGIGLGGAETGHPAGDFLEVFSEAQDVGLKLVAHAGEEVDSSSIWSAVKDLNAMRIGHGTSSINDEELMCFLKEKAIPLEVCPTSNIITQKYVKKLSQHPIKEFYRRGITVTLNTDDPILFHTELNDEIEKTALAVGFSPWEVLDIMMNNFRCSFMNEKKKQNYLSQMIATATNL